MSLQFNPRGPPNANNSGMGQSQAPPQPATTYFGKVKEFFYPPTNRERAARMNQMRDVAFFSVMTGSCLFFEKTLHYWLVKEVVK